MTTKQRKAAFARRLKSLLIPLGIHSGAKLARAFNLCHPGEPVTNQAAYKWIRGKAFPRPDNLRTLAKLLNANEYWLANGLPPDLIAKPLRRGENYPLHDEMIEWASRMMMLKQKDCSIVQELIAHFGDKDEKED